VYANARQRGGQRARLTGATGPWVAPRGEPVTVSAGATASTGRRARLRGRKARRKKFAHPNTGRTLAHDYNWLARLAAGSHRGNLRREGPDNGAIAKPWRRVACELVGSFNFFGSVDCRQF
jgi:hypothetical protein